MYRCRSIINTQPTALAHTTLVPESGDSSAYLVQLEIWALEQKYKRFPSLLSQCLLIKLRF